MPVTRVDGLVLSLCGRHLLAICGDKAIREFSVAERLATAHAPAAQPASTDVEVWAATRTPWKSHNDASQTRHSCSVAQCQKCARWHAVTVSRNIYAVHCILGMQRHSRISHRP